MTLTWSVVPQQQSTKDYYWKWGDSVTMQIGSSEPALRVVASVSTPRLVSLSITQEPSDPVQKIWVYLTDVTTELYTIGETQKPDLVWTGGFNMTNWEMSAGIYIKKEDPNFFGFFLTYKTATKEYL